MLPLTGQQRYTLLFIVRVIVRHLKRFAAVVDGGEMFSRGGYLN